MKILNFIEINRFILIGGTATAIDLFFYYLFSSFGFFDLSNSKRFSFFLAANFAFLFNRNYVFKSKKKISNNILII